MRDYLDFVQIFREQIQRKRSAIFYFSAKYIAKGSIHERKNKKRASGSLGDAPTKLYKVEY